MNWELLRQPLNLELYQKRESTVNMSSEAKGDRTQSIDRRLALSKRGHSSSLMEGEQDG